MPTHSKRKRKPSERAQLLMESDQAGIGGKGPGVARIAATKADKSRRDTSRPVAEPMSGTAAPPGVTLTTTVAKFSSSASNRNDPPCDGEQDSKQQEETKSSSTLISNEEPAKRLLAKAGAKASSSNAALESPDSAATAVDDGSQDEESDDGGYDFAGVIPADFPQAKALALDQLHQRSFSSVDEFARWLQSIPSAAAASKTSSSPIPQSSSISAAGASSSSSAASAAGVASSSSMVAAPDESTSRPASGAGTSASPNSASESGSTRKGGRPSAAEVRLLDLPNEVLALADVIFDHHENWTAKLPIGESVSSLQAVAVCLLLSGIHRMMFTKTADKKLVPHPGLSHRKSNQSKSNGLQQLCRRFFTGRGSGQPEKILAWYQSAHSQWKKMVLGLLEGRKGKGAHPRTSFTIASVEMLTGGSSTAAKITWNLRTQVDLMSPDLVRQVVDTSHPLGLELHPACWTEAWLSAKRSKASGEQLGPASVIPGASPSLRGVGKRSSTAPASKRGVKARRVESQAATALGQLQRSLAAEQRDFLAGQRELMMQYQASRTSFASQESLAPKLHNLRSSFLRAAHVSPQLRRLCNSDQFFTQLHKRGWAKGIEQSLQGRPRAVAHAAGFGSIAKSEVSETPGMEFLCEELFRFVTAMVAECDVSAPKQEIAMLAHAVDAMLTQAALVASLCEGVSSHTVEKMTWESCTIFSGWDGLEVPTITQKAASGGAASRGAASSSSGAASGGGGGVGKQQEIIR